jgi:hypothetical protein
VAVLDVLDQTAVAKVTAAWGGDYMQLAKFEGRWKIVQILAEPPAERVRYWALLRLFRYPLATHGALRRD